ncbi:MAG: GDSL-type esterase/lipase family protein [Bryobacteraceae bacterium]
MVRFFALLLSVCFGLAAQTVNINVPAVNSKGNQVSVGQVFISWHSFPDNSGKLVQGSQKTVNVSNGIISTSLVPSDNAGYVYNVLLMSGGEASNSTWRVPSGTAVTQLAQLVPPPATSPTGYDPAGAAAAAVAAIPNASATTTGLLSKNDWAGFNAKQSPLGFTPPNPANNLSEYAANAAAVRSNLGLGSAGTHPATDFDGAGAASAAVAGIPSASSTTTGLLSKTDWTAFNAKQPALGFTPANPANNLSEYASNAASVRTNLGLGSASTHPVSDFDAAGAATAAQAAAIAASDPAGAATTAQTNAIASSVQKSTLGPNQLLGITASGAPFVDLSDPVLSTWLSALRNANNQVVNVVVIGDSIAQGLGTVSNGGKFYNSWAQQFTAHLHTLFGNGGSGIIPVYYGVGAWTQTGTWTEGGSNLGPLQTGISPFNHLYSATGTANNLALMAMDGDKVNVYTQTAPDSGACTVSIDGTVVGTTPATTSAGLQAVKTTFAASTFGSHTLTITPTTTGKCYVYAAEWTIGSTGVRVHNVGVAGARSEAFGSSPATQNAFLNVIPGGIQLAIVSLGVNDFHAGNNETLSTYTSNMQNLLTYVAGVSSPSPSVVMLDENQPNTLNQTPAVNAQFTWSQLLSAEQSLAVSNNAAFVSISELWGSYTSANALGMMAADGVHPNDKGHLYYSYVLEHRLLKGAPPLLMGDTGVGNMATQYSQFLSPSSTFGGVPGHYNTAFGVKAGYAVTGDKNTFFGNGAGQGFTTGSSNTAVGAFACQSPTLTGSNLTCLGAGAQMASGMANAAQIGPGTNSVNGTLQWWGWNIADAYGNVNTNLVKRSVGTAVASAATIAPTSGMTHITGTTAISSITVPGITVSGTAFTGCLVLIPDGAWTTTTTGNIAAASTAVVGKQMEMCYDGSKWYPNY